MDREGRLGEMEILERGRNKEQVREPERETLCWKKERDRMMKLLLSAVDRLAAAVS